MRVPFLKVRCRLSPTIPVSIMQQTVHVRRLPGVVFASNGYMAQAR